MMLAAIVALALVAAVPAVAQVAGGVGQESESGDFSANFSVENTGDYASQCTPAIQQGNTGNFNNAPSFLQYASEADDFQPGGIEVAFEPSLTADCSSTIQQSSAASSGGSDPPAGGSGPKPTKKQR